MNKRSAWLLIVVIGVTCSAQAATRTWQGGSGGLWTNTANWVGGVLPVANDVADLTAATGTIDLTADVTVGEIFYNPVFSGTTNTLTILSDTAAPASRSVTLTTTATRRVRISEGAELLLEADLKPNSAMTKDGYGTLVIRRKLVTVTLSYVEQGRLVNEGTITFTGTRLCVGTLEPDAGPAAEFVMREGSSYYSTSIAAGSDFLFGGNRLLAVGTGSRAVITHEGGVIDLTTNATGGVFLNGYAAGGYSAYNLSDGEVNCGTKGVYIAFYGTGTVSQTGGKLKASYITFSAATTSRGVYDFTGGELWLGGIAAKGSGAAAFNLGGGCLLYPLNKGFTINSDTNPKLTNGLVRFCSTGSGFTNTVSGLGGPGGLVKEGADTLNVAGASFSGPLIVSNGMVNVSSAMTGGNAVLVAGGNLNLNDGALARFSSLMVTNGVFQVASNGLFALKSSDPWARVAGTGTVRLLAGASLLCLAVSEAGVIDLSAGGTSTVYRLALDGVEQAPGFYTSANCAAITGTGTLAVILQKDGRGLSDTFTRADGATLVDSLGKTETGGADWAEFLPFDAIGNAASVTNGEVRLGVGTSDPGLALTAATWPNGLFSTRMRFNLIGSSGATVKNGCGLLLRRSVSSREGTPPGDWLGSVHVLVTAAGGVFLRENYDNTRVSKNPFTGGDFLTYGVAGTLPTSINGLPFDANGDGRLGSDEPFELNALLNGVRLQVMINGEPVMASNSFATNNPAAESCAGFFKNRLSSTNVETHDSYHDDFSATNLPFFIRHIGGFDPNVGIALPRENWNLGGSTNLVSVGPVTETVGSETVEAWKIDDASSDTGATLAYSTGLSSTECDDVNTNRWRFTLRLRVVNTNDAVDWGVCGQVSTDSHGFTLRLGSDASGNARVMLNDGAVDVVEGGSMYHTYTLEYTPKTSSANLFCDGALLKSGVAWTSGANKRLLFGAGSSADQGCAHYALVQFEFLPPPPIPPAGTLIRVR
jgi:hypothetical protein